MKNIILLGAPGTGKGTQAANISKWFGIPHISTGDIFRSNIKAGTELGVLAKKHTDLGQLVPDDITIGLVAGKIAEADCAGGFILDGFPRNIPQAEALDEILAANGNQIHAAVSIYVPDETIIKRLSGRRLCGKCEKPYHTVYNPPAVDGICDDCGGALIQRADDSEGTIRERLSVYYQQTEPVIDHYRRQGIYIRITGHELVEDTTNETYEALKAVFNE